MSTIRLAVISLITLLFLLQQHGQAAPPSDSTTVVHVVYAPSLDSLELYRDFGGLDYRGLRYLSDVYTHLRELVTDSGVTCVAHELRDATTTYQDLVSSVEAFEARRDHGPFTPQPFAKLVLDGVGTVRLIPTPIPSRGGYVRQLILDREGLIENYHTLRDASDDLLSGKAAGTYNLDGLLKDLRSWKARRYTQGKLSTKNLIELLDGLAANRSCSRIAVVLCSTFDAKDLFAVYRERGYRFDLHLTRVQME